MQSPFATASARATTSSQSLDRLKTDLVAVAAVAGAPEDSIDPPGSARPWSGSSLYVSSGSASLPPRAPAPAAPRRRSLDALNHDTTFHTDLLREVADGLRSISDGTGSVRNTSLIAAVLHPTGVPVRIWGEGDGWWWTSPDVPQPTAQQVSMAQFVLATENQTSWKPLMFWAPNFFGKLLMAVGADMLMEGISRAGGDFVWAGGFTLAGGILMTGTGMALLVRDIQKINRHRVPLYLGCSVAGSVLVASALVLAVSNPGQRLIAVRTGAFIVMTGGLGMLTYTLPFSFACSEIVRGCVFRRHRAQVQLGSMALGMAVSALTLTRSSANSATVVKFPFGVSHAIAVTGIGLMTFAAAIGASDYQRMNAGRLARRMVADVRNKARAAMDPV